MGGVVRCLRLAAQGEALDGLAQTGCRSGQQQGGGEKVCDWFHTVWFFRSLTGFCFLALKRRQQEILTKKIGRFEMLGDCISAISSYNLGVAIPTFNSLGDLPAGVHRTTLEECLQRFGESTEQRRKVTATLLEICRLAEGTGKLDRIIVFGSYVTAKREPRDVDIILVMKDSGGCDP